MHSAGFTDQTFLHLLFVVLRLKLCCTFSFSPVNIKLTLEMVATLPPILSLSLSHSHAHTHTVLLLRSICYSVEICSNSMGVSHPFCMGDWGLCVNAYYAKILNLAALKEAVVSMRACVFLLSFFSHSNS